MENGTKLRLLYIYQHLLRHSDAEHPVSTPELMKYLKDNYGMEVNRTTIPDDFAMMEKAGIHFEVIKSRQNKYYFDDRLFDLAELKTLIDAVASSKFITEKRSKKLIQKITTLTSEFNAEKLRRHVTVEGRVKTDNKNSIIIIDAINRAIDEGRKIRFQYADYSIHKRRVLKNGGEYYTVSPYALVWDGDFYYVSGYCDNRQHTRNFRIDRIYKDVEVLEDEPALPAPKDYDPAAYSKMVFRMYDSDEPVDVELRCEASLMKYVIDQFGTSVKTKAEDDDYFTVNVAVCPSPTFYRWVFGWGGKMKILSPNHIKDEYKQMLAKAIENA